MRVGVGVELQSEQNATNEQTGWAKTEDDRNIRLYQGKKDKIRQ